MFKPFIKYFLFASMLLAAASSQATVLKIATLSPDGSVWMKKMRAGGDLIAQRGRMPFRLFVKRGRAFDRLQDELFSDTARKTHMDTRIDQRFGEKEDIRRTSAG